MSFNEEVTRHSVHTLVFRSLKRTHDMFLSDANNLPPVDEKAEALWKKTKARSMYGPIMEKVDREKSRGQFGQNAAALAIEDKTNANAAAPTPQSGQLTVYGGAGASAAAQKAQQVGPGGVLAAVPGAGPDSLRGSTAISLENPCRCQSPTGTRRGSCAE